MLQPSVASSMIHRFRLTEYSATKNQKYLPATFVDYGLNLKLKTATLRVRGGRQWKWGIYRAGRRENEARLSIGWLDFISDVGLKAGDIVEFQSIDPSKNDILVNLRSN